MPVHVGPLVITTRRWIDDLADKLLGVERSLGRDEVLRARMSQDVALLQSVTTRQAEMLRGATTERDIAVSRLRECMELLAEQATTLDELTRHLGLPRHPVYGPPEEAT